MPRRYAKRIQSASLWVYFDPLLAGLGEGTHYCTLCDQKFTLRTSGPNGFQTQNLRNHLKKKHRAEAEILWPRAASPSESAEVPARRPTTQDTLSPPQPTDATNRPTHADVTPERRPAAGPFYRCGCQMDVITCGTCVGRTDHLNQAVARCGVCGSFLYVMDAEPARAMVSGGKHCCRTGTPSRWCTRSRGFATTPAPR